ncbi:MAG TPA: DbpA RNA binding domain-containing protein, partial [Paludibacteraceae bacterium]|nr:DbpA RNA binding domain-containing protein [Paludibacteraceae bacterium]
CYILVSTDLAARGLDIPEVKNVVHYHLPLNEEAYTHRNGRTARMFAEGSSFILLNSEESLPEYVDQNSEEMELPEKSTLPGLPEWVTLYIGKGKQDKLSKGDIAGFLMKKGRLNKNELGKIELKEHYSFAAIKRDRAKNLLQLVANEKIKGVKTIFELAR